MSVRPPACLSVRLSAHCFHSLLGAFLTNFLQTCYESWYWEKVIKGFQKWIWYLLSLIYLSFHTYCQWKNFRKHLLLLVNSINNLSLPLRTISACILRYYVIEATQVTVCYSAYTWFSNFDKYTVLLWFCCTWKTKMQTSLGYLTGWLAPLLFNISEVRKLNLPYTSFQNSS